MSVDPVDSVDPGKQGGLIVRLLRRASSNTFVRHVLTLMSGTMVAQGLMVVAMVVVGRLFSVTEYAIYTIVMSLVSAVVPIAGGRYELAIVLPKRDDDARQLLRLASWINAVVSLVVVLVMLVVRDPISALILSTRGQQQDAEVAVGELSPWLLFVGPLVWVTTQLAIMSYWLTRNSRFGLVSQNRIYQAVSVSALQIGSGVARTGVVGLVVATFVGEVMALWNLLRKTRGEYRFEGTAPSKAALAKEHVKMPALNGINALADSIRINGINLMLPGYFGAAALGQFSLAWMALQAPMALINSAISQVFFPALAKVKRGEMFVTVRNATVRSVLIGIVPFGLIWWLGPTLIPWLFGKGDKWALAGEICRVLVPWLYVNFITSPISTVFVVIRRQFTMLIFALFFMAVPLTVIALHHDDILSTLSLMSWAMAGMLVVLIILALVVSWQYDRGFGMRADEDQP